MINGMFRSMPRRQFGRVSVGVVGNEIASGWDQQHVVKGDAIVHDLGVFHVILL